MHSHNFQPMQTEFAELSSLTHANMQENRGSFSDHGIIMWHSADDTKTGQHQHCTLHDTELRIAALSSQWSCFVWPILACYIPCLHMVHGSYI